MIKFIFYNLYLFGETNFPINYSTLRFAFPVKFENLWLWILIVGENKENFYNFGFGFHNFFKIANGAKII